MAIYNYSGEQVEINAYDTNGIEYAADLIGNHEDFSQFDDDGYPIMTDDQFNFWTQNIARFELAQNLITDNLHALTVDEREELDNECQCDLEDWPNIVFENLLEFGILFDKEISAIENI